MRIKMGLGMLLVCLLLEVIAMIMQRMGQLYILVLRRYAMI